MCEKGQVDEAAAARGLMAAAAAAAAALGAAGGCTAVLGCSDLHGTLLDLGAAWGVESGGLLEEELSGCLECLKEEWDRLNI